MMRKQTGSPAIRFTVDVFLSEALEFDLAEIAKAVTEDHPGAVVCVSPFTATTQINTDEATRAELEPADPQNGSIITLSSAGAPDGAFRDSDHTELAWRSGAHAETALAAIEDHQSLVTLSIQASDASLAARFRAARQLTAVSAVFAQLPIALGIMVHWSDHIVSPEAWVEAARRAEQGEWPLMEWISYRSGWVGTEQTPPEFATGFTTGLARFLDFELSMEAAPIRPSDVVEMLHFACWLPLDGGNTYRDGDTLGMQDSAVTYTLRRRDVVTSASVPRMVLLHPNSPVDEHALFGPNPLLAPPDWLDTERWPKVGFMQRLLGKPRTLH